MNTIATADAYVRGNPANFSGLAPPGNPNPAGDIDGRLANLFLTIDVDFLLQPPNTQWPTSNVPPCMTFTATPTTVIAPGAAQLTWSSGTGPYQAASCLLSASDGSFSTSTPFAGASGSAPTGPLNKVGTYSAQLICSTASSTISGFAQTTVNVIQLAAISVGPAAPPPQIAAGGTVQLIATGTYSDQSTKDVTCSVSWASANTTVATVTAGGLVTCVSSASTAQQVVISALGTTATGTVPVTCLAPTLTSVVLAPSNPTLAAGSSLQLTATANFSYGSPQNVTGSATWSTSNSSVATVSGGLVTCVAGVNNAVMITATSGSGSGSTTVTCQAPALQSISVTPKSSGEIGEIPNGGTQQMTATGTYSYGPPRNITSAVTWTSSAPTVATVSATGLLSCKRRYSYSDGNTIISATSGTTTGSSNITCEGQGF
jgi:hypothetical protein